MDVKVRISSSRLWILFQTFLKPHGNERNININVCRQRIWKKKMNNFYAAFCVHAPINAGVLLFSENRVAGLRVVVSCFPSRFLTIVYNKYVHYDTLCLYNIIVIIVAAALCKQRTNEKFFLGTSGHSFPGNRSRVQPRRTDYAQGVCENFSPKIYN